MIFSNTTQEQLFMDIFHYGDIVDDFIDEVNNIRVTDFAYNNEFYRVYMKDGACTIIERF